MKGSIILWSCVIVFSGLVIALLFLQRYFLIEYLESTVTVLSADKEAYVFVGQGKAIRRATQLRAMSNTGCRAWKSLNLNGTT